MSLVVINGVQRRLNWKRQGRDDRDYSIEAHHPATIAALPPRATTQTRARPAVRNQLALGSCTQNAGAAAMAFVWMVLRGAASDPLFSRLFGYFFTRQLEGVPATEDSGCQVRDVFKAYRRWGICFESTWPYDVEKFSIEPDDRAKAEAMMHQALVFYAAFTLNAIKKSIADGWPVIFGFDCFESLDSPEVARTGRIPLPERGERNIGGHCMFLDTYDDSTGEVSGNNSWGDEDWGDVDTHTGRRGRFHMSYDYFSRGLASDANSLRSTEV